MELMEKIFGESKDYKEQPMCRFGHSFFGNDTDCRFCGLPSEEEMNHIKISYAGRLNAAILYRRARKRIGR